MGRDPLEPNAGHIAFVHEQDDLERRMAQLEREARVVAAAATAAPRKPPMDAERRRQMDNARVRVVRRLNFDVE
jgi:hypothetical protein